MDQILASHRIDPDTLRRDDFDVFFEHRADALLDRIEQATGKTVVRDPEIFRVVDDYDEEEPEWEENGGFEDGSAA